MVENSNFITIPAFLAEADKLNKNIISIVTFMKEPISVQNEVIVQETSSAEKFRVKKSIYACKFCNVFSSSESEIATHITSVHRASLPCGTKAENFVSRMQALQNENKKKKRSKGGRPRKKINSNVVEEKELVSEPVLGPDGLYWCEKCHRRFKKPRQVNRHVCHEIAAENFSNESAADSDCTDFQTYMDIEPTPWLRRPKHSNKSNAKKSSHIIQSPNDETLYASNLSTPANAGEKLKIYWRDDPNYVQLFENDAERYAFEEHLKSIDYSCVDSLFVKVQNKSKSFKKRRNKSSNITLYSCIICQKEFHSLSHIRMHCLTHTDVKPFTCPKCPYRSNTKGSLYTHMRNHTGKLFHCSKCGFKTIKRSHLLEHEQTHSSVLQLCKLCKNTYKTIKSLIAHVHRYHNNPEGKKYAKFLSGKSSKDSFIKCNICRMKFKTQTSFSTHTHTVVPALTTVGCSPENIHNTSATVDYFNENIQNTSVTIHHSNENIQNTSVLIDHSDENIQNTSTTIDYSNENIQNTSATIDHSNENIQNTSATIDHSNENTQNTSAIINHSKKTIQNTPSCEVNQAPVSSMQDNNMEYTNAMQILKCPLDEIVLSDFLQQKNSEIYQNVFQQCSNSHIQIESESLSNAFTVESASRELSQLNVDKEFQTSNTVLEECEKTLGIDLIKECLKDSSFADQVIAETCNLSSKLANDSESFVLHEIQMGYSNESVIPPTIARNGNLGKSLSHIDSELNDKTDSADFASAEPNSVETKLFESCRQTPAYVCCVCSAIYVCPVTLKAHLKEHVNTNNSLIEQDSEDMIHAKLSEADATIDSVCKMLEDSDNEKELEKLYINSMDMMYYLPEVSVLLENDPKFIDAVLNDFSNFPLSDKYDESEFTEEM